MLHNNRTKHYPRIIQQQTIHRPAIGIEYKVDADANYSNKHIMLIII